MTGEEINYGIGEEYNDYKKFERDVVYTMVVTECFSLDLE